MFSDNLRKMREDKGISQVVLSQKIGVGVSTVNMWEKGKRNPKIDKLVLLSKFFDCTVDELIGGK